MGGELRSSTAQRWNQMVEMPNTELGELVIGHIQFSFKGEMSFEER